MPRNDARPPSPLFRSWIERIAPFEGPEGTNFLFDRSERRWYILGEEGSEALVPARDLLAFVEKCLSARTRPAPRAG